MESELWLDQIQGVIRQEPLYTNEDKYGILTRSLNAMAWRHIKELGIDPLPTYDECVQQLKEKICGRTHRTEEAIRLYALKQESGMAVQTYAGKYLDQFRKAYGFAKKADELEQISLFVANLASKQMRGYAMRKLEHGKIQNIQRLREFVSGSMNYRLGNRLWKKHRLNAIRK